MHSNLKPICKIEAYEIRYSSLLLCDVVCAYTESVGHFTVTLYDVCTQVKSLIAEGEQFGEKEVVVMAEKVRQLQSIYKSVEEAGSHAFLNELRALNTSLTNKWTEFEKSLTDHMSNLDLSLRFQETLFEVIKSIHLYCLSISKHCTLHQFHLNYYFEDSGPPSRTP